MLRLFVRLPLLWLVIFGLLPLLILARISLSSVEAGLPGWDAIGAWQWRHYTTLWQDPLYLRTLWHSLCYAALTTLVCLVLAYPCAWGMARTDRRWQPLLVMTVLAPFWTSVLLRVYAWKGLLNDGGWLAQVLNAWRVDEALLWLGWIPMPGQYLYTPFSLVLGLVYTYLPFMVLPLYASLVRQERRLLEAAADLGATPWQAFMLVTWPLSRPGVLAGGVLVFVPCVGEFVIPSLLGGPETHLIGRLLWDDFFANNDWPMAASAAMALLALALAPLAWFSRRGLVSVLTGWRHARRWA